ncbi:MAG: glycosyltransferase family 4 protein [Cyanothece sp. SIO2G6]|nr:glycosyltransferase family 4 protein [Cyanothece sp. SIO2G6]
MVYAANLFPHLQALNPTLLSSVPVPGFAHRPVPKGMTAEQGFKGHLRRLVWTQTQLPEIYRTEQAALLFSPIPESPLYSSVRSVVTVHDLIPLHFGKPRSPLTLYQRYYVPAVLRQSYHIIANSQATANDVVTFFNIPARKITPIPLAYGAENFRFLDRPTQPYLVYLGRCDPYKNVGAIIQALAELVGAIAPEITLKIAGSRDPRYTPMLEQQAQALGIAHRVEFLDYVPYDQLPILLGEAIALVFPSLWEGFGLPVLEAMACGTPVITSNRASLPEVAGDAALFIDPDDPATLTDAMLQVITDDELRQQLRQAGLARAQQFSWAKTGAATVEVLRQQLG